MRPADAAARALQRFQRALEPAYVLARKRGRLAALGFDDIAGLPVAPVDLAADDTGCTPDCGQRIDLERRYLRPYLFAGPSAAGGRWRATPFVIDLERYPAFGDYLRHLKSFSKGGTLREIRKARAQGYFARTIFRALYRGQISAVESSKWVRSGIVVAALLHRRGSPDFADGIDVAAIAAHLGRPAETVGALSVFPPPPAPSCPLHWAIDWGVFLPAAAAAGPDQPGERLVGYLSLQRTGNIVRVAELMGHGAHLAHGVMKLLFHDTMRWLIERDDPAVRGVRFVHYGAVEHGYAGLVAWKRRFAFAPARFAWAPPPQVETEGRIPG